ncbi:beta and beta-prime subunits of DNA dependent RNA-polymerase, partial [Lichtheimia hyalospora FSU 10163]
MKDFSKIYEEYKKIIIKNEKETDKYKTIIKRISSKKGLFRNNILGKRTRLCGRSVITPDIFLKIDEIGVPYEMANKLTFKNRNLRNN